MSSRMRCARMMLIIFNAVFSLCGLAALVVGIWMRINGIPPDIVDFVSVGQDDDMEEYAVTVGYTAPILIAIGTLAVVVGLCGCCGAIQKSKFLLGVYIFFLLVLMAGELGAGILFVVYKDDVGGELEKDVKDLMRDPDNNPFIYKVDDDKYVFSAFGQLLSYGQKELKCCGLENGHGVTEHGYGASEVTVIDGKTWKYLPTCCENVVDDKDRDDLAENPNDWVDKVDEYIPGFSVAGTCTTYKNGCVEGSKEWFKDKAVILTGVAIGIACLQLFGIVFAICFCRTL